MGKYLTLINGDIRDLAASEWRNISGQRITSEKDRYEKIESLAESGSTIAVYANKDFDVAFNNEVIHIKEGRNDLPPRFAFWLFGIYGVNQRYGALARIRGIVVSDEPFDGKNEEPAPRRRKTEEQG